MTELERKMLLKFPKRRHPLPEAYQAIYVNHYKNNRQGATPASSLSKGMETWMHRKVAADTISRPEGYTTLEVGAGSLNHLQYEPRSGHYDIVEPFAELYENTPDRSRIREIYRDLSDVSNRKFDRIIAIATFEHLCDLPSAIARCGLMLDPSGQIRAAIPSEGTLLWWLGWRLTTGVEFRLRNRLDYGVLMRHEHVNTAKEIVAILCIFFKSVRRSILGISPALSFYQFFECTHPDREKCSDYLNRQSFSRPSPAID
jgi:hypothetical protein